MWEKITKFSMARVGIEELILKPEKENQKKKNIFWRSYGEDKSIAIIIILMINNFISNLETDHY